MKQVWVVALLLVLPAVLATNISTSETKIVMEGSFALVEHALVVNSETEVGNLTLILSQNPDDVEIVIDGAEASCLLQGEFARCGSLAAGSHNVTVNYETGYPIASVGENTIFRYTDRLPYQAESQQVTLTLPVGYIIPREKDKDESFYISPAPADVYSDGQRIILHWVQKGQELPISVIARRVVGPPLVWIGTAALSALIAAALVVWFVLSKVKEPKQKSVKKKKAVVVPALMDNEQRIVEFLKQNGEVWQKQIQAATSFSKAKVSRIIRNLEERGVITKTIYGNTNKIALKQK